METVRFAQTNVAKGLGLLSKPHRKVPAARDIKRTVGEMLKQKNTAR